MRETIVRRVLWMGLAMLAAGVLTGYLWPKDRSEGVITAREVRIVDSTGRVTATIGNTVDGRSPTILLYDGHGRVGLSLLVDNQTGQVSEYRGAPDAPVRYAVDRR